MRYIFCLALTFHSFLAVGQKNATADAAKENPGTSIYKVGYIVTQDGDTLHGFISEVYYPYYPKYLKYRSSMNVKSEKFASDQIRAFGFSTVTLSGKINLRFEVHAFKFDADRLGYKEFSYPLNVTPGYPTTRLPVKWLDEKCFLRLHTSGKYNLYSFSDRDNNLHFFINSNEAPELIELQHRDYLVYKEGVSSIATSNYYRQQLINIAGACKTDVNLSSLPYREKNLIRAIEAINKCAANSQL